MDVKSFSRTRQWFLVSMFLAGLWLPLLGTFFHWGTSDSASENRRLADAPSVSLLWKSSTRFYKQLKEFLTDRFGFRAPLVKLHSNLLVSHLAVSPHPDVLLGKDGWLYLAGERNIEDYLCVSPFTAADLEQWRSVLEQRRDWLASQGILYVFVVAPNTHTIYPEHLPASLHRVRQESRLDQLAGYLKTHSDLVVVDLRPALFQAKTREQIYFRTDTHWNARGAFVAARELLKVLNQRIPSVVVPERSEFVETETEEPGGDLAGMLGMKETLREVIPNLAPKQPRSQAKEEWSLDQRALLPTRPQRVLKVHQEKGGRPALLMFHDSFGNGLEPFLSPAFDEAMYVFCGIDFDPSLVALSKPTVVIQEIVERRLMSDNSSHMKPLVP